MDMWSHMVAGKTSSTAGTEKGTSNKCTVASKNEKLETRLQLVLFPPMTYMVSQHVVMPRESLIGLSYSHVILTWQYISHNIYNGYPGHQCVCKDGTNITWTLSHKWNMHRANGSSCGLLIAVDKTKIHLIHWSEIHAGEISQAKEDGHVNLVCYQPDIYKFYL